MALEFSKLQGTGNDFIVIDDRDETLEITDEQIAMMCDRHFGVGADGLILVKPSPRENCIAYMDYYNSDGTRAEMCGNGVRCFAKYLVDHHIVEASEGSVTVDTLAGPRPLTFTVDEDDEVEDVTVDMGEPVLAAEKIPTLLRAADPDAPVIDVPLTLDDTVFEVTCVSMGNPHAVIFVDDVDSLSLETLGPLIESAPEFPEKTNVEFAEVSGDFIKMRVWERGCAETLACGTGACAVVVAGALSDRSGRKSTVKLPGGDLRIDWADDGHVYLTGQAEEVFDGLLVL
ncbi:MAG: diaminopimelate epimerase [Coriobacteriaceae bacterium]|nr:diaminopimelate epimerase [Coriobacteriaceae bacterium]